MFLVSYSHVILTAATCTTAFLLFTLVEALKKLCLQLKICLLVSKKLLPEWLNPNIAQDLHNNNFEALRMVIGAMTVQSTNATGMLL